MKRSLKLIALSGCLFVAVAAQAQVVEKTPVTDVPAVKTPLESFFKRSVGLHVGSQGFGFEVQHPLPYHMNLRLGVSVIPNMKTSGVYTLSSYNTQVNASTANFWNAHMLMDVQPFYKAKSFVRKLVLTTGAAYFPEAKATALVKFDQDFKYGDLTFSAAEVGQLTTTSSWAGFAPYGGIGFNDLVKANRYNMSLNLGTYFMEEPEVQITGTNMLKGNHANSKQLEKNMAGYRWLPVIQLNFNYSL